MNEPNRLNRGKTFNKKMQANWLNEAGTASVKMRFCFYGGQGLFGLVDCGLTGRRYQREAPDDKVPAGPI